ncbi:SCO2584 family spore wall biosynthesis protein [Streptomyces sp. SGAir0957]
MTPQVYSGQVPEDVGGAPFPDGGEPDDDHDRGGWDEEFASVVFDEDFVQAAEVHEPTAVERLLAAAEARAEAQEAEARRARTRRGPDDDDLYEAGDGYGAAGFGRLHDDADALYEEGLEQDGRGGPHPGLVRWRRPVAWALALLMGVGMVALAFTAVYRGASSGRQEQVPPPATTELEKGLPGPPSASVDHSRPAVSAVPRTP